MAKRKKNGLDTVSSAEREQANPTKSIDTTAGHNSGERAKIMQECAEQMRGIKAERKELNDRAGEIRKRLEDAGINVKAWEAMLRIADMDDQAARDSYVDGLQEAYSALAPGQTLDFVSVLDQTRTRTPTDKEARTAGREAGRAGKKFDDNPHPEGTNNHKEWAGGWTEGQTEIIETLGSGQTQGAAEAAAAVTA
jgi:hypothetical protein